MRTKMIVGILLALIAAAGGCQNSNLTAWGLSGHAADLVGRVGIERDDAEAGVTVKYWSSNLDWGPSPDAAGAYFIYHLTQEITVEDTPETSPIQDVLESLNARPYAGFEFVTPTGGRHRTVDMNWILGTSFTADPDRRWAFVTEYTAGNGAVSGRDNNVLSIGARGRF